MADEADRTEAAAFYGIALNTAYPPADRLACALKALAYYEDSMAQAWQEGYTSGHSRAMRLMSDEPLVAPGTNPYTTTKEEE